MKYSASFQKGGHGNQITEGGILTIKIDGAHFFSGGVYKNGLPVLAFQTQPGDNDIELLIKRKGLSLKGTAVLKVRAYDKAWRGAGWNDQFEIV